jgi:tRNA(fMet)-specific endonuclease VapC
MYLLDTDILSNLLKPRPSQALIDRMAVVPARDQFTSSITLGELIYGAYRAGARRTGLLQRIETILPPNVPILPFDEDAAHRYGEVKAYLDQQGTPIGDADSRIAAIALTRGLIMVTGNVRHFQRVPGLAVENWLE